LEQVLSANLEEGLAGGQPQAHGIGMPGAKVEMWAHGRD
jgi:hypothetical protein